MVLIKGSGLSNGFRSDGYPLAFAHAHAMIIPHARSETLFPIIREKVRPHSIVYADTFRAYDVLDVSEFHHLRINHSELFAADANHINGVENFWNQAKRRLRRIMASPAI